MYDFVDRFRNEHPQKVVWAWTNRGRQTVVHFNYVDLVLVKNLDVELKVSRFLFDSLHRSLSCQVSCELRQA